MVTSKLKYGKAPVHPSFWFKEAGLYHEEDYKFEDFDHHGIKEFRKNLLSVIYPTITVDKYCPSCRRSTVFVPVKRENDWSIGAQITVPFGVHYAHFICSRGACKSNLYFIFTIFDGVLKKIGQSPSIADLLSPEINKYRKILNEKLISDWQRALGLRAHGIGAGSYVYLRRIIEYLVAEAASSAAKSGEFDMDLYNRSRWPEKIKMLSVQLPTYLVDNATIYGILSKGVHELSEEECADYFDVMHTSIEIICEQKLAEAERKQKEKDGSKALQKVWAKIKE